MRLSHELGGGEQYRPLAVQVPDQLPSQHTRQLSEIAPYRLSAPQLPPTPDRHSAMTQRVDLVGAPNVHASVLEVPPEWRATGVRIGTARLD